MLYMDNQRGFSCVAKTLSFFCLPERRIGIKMKAIREKPSETYYLPEFVWICPLKRCLQECMGRWLREKFVEICEDSFHKTRFRCNQTVLSGHKMTCHATSSKYPMPHPLITKRSVLNGSNIEGVLVFRLEGANPKGEACNARFSERIPQGRRGNSRSQIVRAAYFLSETRLNTYRWTQDLSINKSEPSLPKL